MLVGGNERLEGIPLPGGPRARGAFCCARLAGSGALTCLARRLAHIAALSVATEVYSMRQSRVSQVDWLSIESTSR